jgi:Protein of unknown function (DUF1460)
MTDNPQFYTHLGDAEERKKVEAAQKRINQHEWYYIPKSKVAKMEHKIQDGDLIIMTSSLNNLDVEHQGFAIKGQDGRIHLLHASSYHKKVILSPTPLSTYLTKVPAMSGIIVARLNP